MDKKPEDYRFKRYVKCASILKPINVETADFFALRRSDDGENFLNDSRKHQSNFLCGFSRKGHGLGVKQIFISAKFHGLKTFDSPVLVMFHDKGRILADMSAMWTIGQFVVFHHAEIFF